MTRKLKALGLAVVAVLAMSAVVAASGAQAAAPEFHCTSTTANCNFNGISPNGKLVVSKGNVTCTESIYTGTFPKTTATATVKAEYKTCKAFGVKAEVKMNECDYVFNAVAASSPATAKVDVKCPAGKKIEIIAATLPCTVTVGEQSGLEHVVFENEGGAEPTSVIANVTVGNIAVTKTGTGCPEGAGATTGALTDSVTISGFEDPGGTQVGLHVF